MDTPITTGPIFLLGKTAGRFETLGELKSKIGARISAGVGENRRGYYYIRKAWDGVDHPLLGAAGGGQSRLFGCLLFFVV